MMNKKRQNGKRERITKERLFKIKERYMLEELSRMYTKGKMTAGYIAYLIGDRVKEAIEEEYNKKPL